MKKPKRRKQKCKKGKKSEVLLFLYWADFVYNKIVVLKKDEWRYAISHTSSVIKSKDTSPLIYVINQINIEVRFSWICVRKQSHTSLPRRQRRSSTTSMAVCSFCLFRKYLTTRNDLLIINLLLRTSLIALSSFFKKISGFKSILCSLYATLYSFKFLQYLCIV